MLVKQAWKQLIREWRSGELRILFFSIVIAVAAVSSVNFFTNRVQNALESQANELLGADLLLNNDKAFPEVYFEKAKSLKLKTVRQMTFPSMVMSDNGTHLAWLKVVEKNYPLRGELGISHALFAPEEKTKTLPASGEVWIEPRLLTELGIHLHDKIAVGAKQFVVSALLISEPGGGGVFKVAPQVLLNMTDLADTKLIEAGSRVRYSLLLAGDKKSINSYEAFAKKRADVGVTVQTIRDARPEIRIALSRSNQFLGLAALTSVLLAGVAIALAARRYAQRHLDHCAILRCVGATQAYIFNLYLWQIVFIGVIASLVGAIIGYFSHETLIHMLGSLLNVKLPWPGFSPVLYAMATGLITLSGFALPPIFALKNVPALRVIKRDLGSVDVSLVLRYSLGVAAMATLMLLQAGDVKLGLYMVMGTLGAVLILIAVAYVLLRFVRSLPVRTHDPVYLGLRNLFRRTSSSIIQIVAFGLGIMALLILTVIRGDLLDEWQATIPTDAPNRFIINIAPEQVSKMQHFFKVNHVDKRTFYPMIRGRLIAINGKEVSRNSFNDHRARQMLSREWNLSWAKKMSPKNTLVSGKWWTADDHGKAKISVAKNVAENLHLKLGDQLKFKVADQFFQARIASIRDVDWGSFEANFFVLAVPGLLDNFPTTYLSTVYIDKDKFELLNDLVKQFANVTIIDVSAVIKQVREIISRVTLAVEYVFGFTLLAGLMVLFAGIQSTLDERMVESAIMKCLGAKRQQLLKMLWSEYLSLGALAGLVAVLLANVVAMAVSHFVLKMPAHWNFSLLPYGVLGGALGVSIFGVLGSHMAISQPPISVLKKINLSS